MLARAELLEVMPAVAFAYQTVDVLRPICSLVGVRLELLVADCAQLLDALFEVVNIPRCARLHFGEVDLWQELLGFPDGIEND